MRLDNCSTHADAVGAQNLCLNWAYMTYSYVVE
jgi:hypothetical protein